MCGPVVRRNGDLFPALRPVNAPAGKAISYQSASPGQREGLVLYFELAPAKPVL